MKPAAQKQTLKYLKNQSSGIDLSQWSLGMTWDYILILPVCGEVPDLLTQVLQHQAQQQLLVIVVVNRPSDNAHSEQWFDENRVLIQHLQSHAKHHKLITEQHQLLLSCMGFDVLLLNFNEQPFQPQKGVGLARKIAADTALELIYKKVVKTPWIFSTDADVTLPFHYFDSVDDLPQRTIALSLPFEHVSDNEGVLKLQGIYDLKLYYYQQGIQFIGSKYHYIPLGSTLVIEAEAYVKVRGFPSRSGGEDFYVLNKLAKIGHVHQPQAPVVNINIRFSNRVPFGTGPAITKIQQQQHSGEAVKFYHPEIFHILKRWHLALQWYYIENKLSADDHGLNEYWQIESVLNNAKAQVNTNTRWQQFIHEWFDAFKILKSVHFLREKYVSVTRDELLDSDAYQSIITSYNKKLEAI